MGNDSFSADGLVKRFQIDFFGYHKIANGLFGTNHAVLSAMLRVITREHRWPRLLKIRANCRDRTEWEEVLPSLRLYEYSNYLLFICGLFGGLKPAIQLIQWVYEIFPRRYFRIINSSNK
jgi:hypothetical protein